DEGEAADSRFCAMQHDQFFGGFAVPVLGPPPPPPPPAPPTTPAPRAGICTAWSMRRTSVRYSDTSTTGSTPCSVHTTFTVTRRMPCSRTSLMSPNCPAKSPPAPCAAPAAPPDEPPLPMPNGDDEPFAPPRPP